jgi:hypothetical protein
LCSIHCNINGANVFNALKICETKKFLPKIGNICSIALSFPNFKLHLKISITKKITSRPILIIFEFSIESIE